MAPKTRKRATADNSENVDPSEVKKSKLAEALKNVEETAQPKNLGKIEPDPQFPTAGFHVYIDDDGTVYDATLNQTNLGANNNKFYICQVLKQDGADRYCSWFRWGRVGFNGQNSLSYSSLDGAISAFKRKFKEKTGNAFENRENFVAYPKKYDWIKVSLSLMLLIPHFRWTIRKRSLLLS
jgi:poly [ADP-ribose] polymerase